MFPVLIGKNNDTNKKIENVLPKVTTLDNGKLLTVINGVWGKASAPSSLPAVSAADNGDVLTVVEGAWAKAAPVTGAFIVNTTVTPGSEYGGKTQYTFACNKTMAEIMQHQNENVVIIMDFSSIGEGNPKYYLRVSYVLEYASDVHELTCLCNLPDGSSTVTFIVGDDTEYPSFEIYF